MEYPEYGDPEEEYAFLTSGNHSYYPQWVQAYLECSVALSQSVNISVSEDVWISALRHLSTPTDPPTGNFEDLPIGSELLEDLDSTSSLLAESSHGQLFSKTTTSTTVAPTTVDEVVGAVARWCMEQTAPHQRPYLLSWWQQMLWMLAFGLMLTVAIGGNALVMWIVCGE